MLATGAGLLAAAHWPARAQAYPTRPLRIVVPYTPGGTTDVLARLIALHLQDKLGQPVVVENRPGASGLLGSDVVAKAAPDGYTLMVTITGLVQNASLMPSMPYDPVKDFQPVSLLATAASVMVVSSRLAVKDVAEFVALVKSQPGRHGYGSYGAGTTSHILGAQLNKTAALDLTHVPYKGAMPVVNDLLAGQLSVAFLDTGTSAPFITSGKLRALAATGKERLGFAPEVPTMAEQGYAGFDWFGWFGAFLPAGVPAPIVQRLSREIQQAMHLPEVRARVEAMRAVPVGSAAESFTEVVRNDAPMYARMIRDLNIRLD
ncbi:hypothetical protein ASF43_00500 [Pseudorhodoferax sp. Leaf267]|nr:hypothetical protein ASF43_00500 [Pseudorhodoferax sp. Leaf267]